MIRPTRTYLLVWLAGLPVAMATIFWEPMWLGWVGYVALTFLIGGVDVLLGLSRRRLAIDLTTPSILHLGEPAQIDVTLGASARRASDVEILMEVDGEVEHPEVSTLRFDEQGRAQSDVALVPVRRGKVYVRAAHLRWSGPLGLFHRTVRREVDAEISIVPNIVAVRRAALRLATHNTMMHGMKTQRYIGDGTEFESLREYIPGLNIRDINWRASARHRKLLCRENRSERNHRVVLAIDTGLLMREPLEGIPKLDHAINAGLMMGYLSLKMGDQVGLFGFDSSPRAYLEPQHGVHSMQRILEQSSRLEYSTHETNYTLAMAELGNRMRRRSVVVVLTDFTDSISAELMVENLMWMARRHLIIFVAIRDASLDSIAESTPDSVETVNRAVVAGEIRQDREKVLTALKRQGIFCIDGTPSEISIELINRYLEIHRRELV